jgi:hypothetical protein
LDTISNDGKRREHARMLASGIKGMHILTRVPFSCGGALDASQLAARVRRRRFTDRKDLKPG